MASRAAGHTTTDHLERDTVLFSNSRQKPAWIRFNLVDLARDIMGDGKLDLGSKPSDLPSPHPSPRNNLS